MKLIKIKFEEGVSKRIYDKYMLQVQKSLKPLNAKEQEDILLEINSHIYEALQHKKKKNEIDTLLDILDKLGVPAEVLKSLVADKKLQQATQTFNPLHIFKALILNITNGISYVIFFIFYLCLFGFVFLIGAKLINPDEVGLFLENNRFVALGKINPEYLKNASYNEILGNWFIPIMLLSIIILYLLITLLLRLKRKIKQ
jgi:uncharacterized membrane protein